MYTISVHINSDSGVGTYIHEAVGMNSHVTAKATG